MFYFKKNQINISFLEGFLIIIFITNVSIIGSCIVLEIDCFSLLRSIWPSISETIVDLLEIFFELFSGEKINFS